MASALEGRSYVWGEDELTGCEDFVFGRGDWGLVQGSSKCKPRDAPGGPLPARKGERRDRLPLDGQIIFDLVGNMRTFTLDSYQPQTAPCWSQGGVHRDPICRVFGDGRHATRGTSWAEGRPTLAATRYFLDTGVSPLVGFRCARPAN